MSKASRYAEIYTGADTLATMFKPNLLVSYNCTLKYMLRYIFLWISLLL